MQKKLQLLRHNAEYVAVERSWVVFRYIMDGNNKVKRSHREWADDIVEWRRVKPGFHSNAIACVACVA